MAVVRYVHSLQYFMCCRYFGLVVSEFKHIVKYKCIAVALKQYVYIAYIYRKYFNKLHLRRRKLVIYMHVNSVDRILDSSTSAQEDVSQSNSFTLTR